MSSIEVLALDLLDTVVIDPVFTQVPRLLGLTKEQLFSCSDPEAWVAFETGRIDEAAYLGQMFCRGGSASFPTPEQVRDVILQGYSYVEGMQALLEELQSAPTRVWALSNYPPWAQVMRLSLDLDRYFEGYVISYQIGVRKPDPRAFAAFCERCGAEPEKCLFVDDRISNVRAARQFGLQAVQFVSAPDLRQTLAALDVLS